MPKEKDYTFTWEDEGTTGSVSGAVIFTLVFDFDGNNPIPHARKLGQKFKERTVKLPEIRNISLPKTQRGKLAKYWYSFIKLMAQILLFSLFFFFLFIYSFFEYYNFFILIWNFVIYLFLVIHVEIL